MKEKVKLKIEKNSIMRLPIACGVAGNSKRPVRHDSKDQWQAEKFRL